MSAMTVVAAADWGEAIAVMAIVGGRRTASQGHGDAGHIVLSHGPEAAPGAAAAAIA
jgi:hypothetical protein